MTDTVRISDSGRIVIPAIFRKALGIEPGNELVLELEDQTLKLRTRAEGVRRAKSIAAKYADGPSAADELVAERRREAADD